MGVAGCSRRRHELMSTTAPGQVDVKVEDDGMKAKCVGLYKKSHELKTPKFQAVIALCDQKITAVQATYGGGGAGEAVFGTVGQMMVKMYTECKGDAERVLSYGDEQFSAWYDMDMKLFNDEIDTDKNGKIDKKEFAKWVGITWDCSETEANDIFTRWDVNEDESIGPYEYCTLMAVFHAEHESATIEHTVEMLADLEKAMFPCGLGCFLCTAYFGVALCCCTCGLSFVPLCCLSAMSPKPMEYGSDEQVDHQDECDAEIAKKSLASTKAVLQKGPLDSLKTVIRISQA